MEIEATRMAALRAQFRFPRFSDGEYQRRYENIRRLMREQQVGCLLIAGGSGAFGRMWSNIRYVTNMVGKADHCTYALFPGDGLPRAVVRRHAAAGAMVARAVGGPPIIAQPDLLTAVVKAIGEFGCERSRIGIVEFDATTSIPKNHWDFFQSQLPQAEFAVVTRPFLALRLVKSAEEIDCLARSSHFNDVGIQALRERLRPGMTEAEAFGLVYEAVLSGGGELGMVQLASAPMSAADINDQRPYPLDRVIGVQDVINNELGVFYNGYEAQSGKPMTIGRPTPAFREMFDVLLQAYRAIAGTLVAGGTSDDSIRAAQVIRDAGYEAYGAFIQGMHGNHPRLEPEVSFQARSTGRDRPLSYREGMAFVVQPHIVDRERTRSLFLGDTYVIGPDGPKCLNRIPPELSEL